MTLLGYRAVQGAIILAPPVWRERQGQVMTSPALLETAREFFARYEILPVDKSPKS